MNCQNVEISCREVFGGAVYRIVTACALTGSWICSPRAVVSVSWAWACAFPSVRGTVGGPAPGSSPAVPLVLFLLFGLWPV